MIVHTRTALRMVVAIPMTAGTNVEIARAGYAGGVCNYRVVEHFDCWL